MKTYNYKKSASGRVFYFKSEGPRGIIPKGVIFKELEPGYYNLALLSKINNRWQDKELANNADMYKTFRTIYTIFSEFMSTVKHAIVQFEGNTVTKDQGEVSKNIAYQRSLSQMITALNAYGFAVYGYTNDDWEMFENGKIYEAFFVRK